MGSRGGGREVRSTLGTGLLPKSLHDGRDSEKRPVLCRAEDDERTSGEGGTAMVMMLVVATMLMKMTIKRMYRYEMWG